MSEYRITAQKTVLAAATFQFQFLIEYVVAFPLASCTALFGFFKNLLALAKQWDTFLDLMTPFSFYKLHLEFIVSGVATNGTPEFT